MLVEMLLPITESHTLIAVWEFPNKIWEEKELQIKSFISNILNSQNIEFEETKSTDNIVFKLKGKPFKFYEVQNGFNDYFKSIGAIILVN